MKIAIYDGILERHVVDSLERALVARGHEVFNTGKIGHGFEFATAKLDLRRLEIAVSDIIDFAPDWVLVFRPASLPPVLHRRLTRRGIRTIAWFSDDPVLFDLTYGPVVDDYDLVLHCGNETVLSFYESKFGRPTGINVPFWTDHEAFPNVWGRETPTSDALFLGNVQDEVRRSRYFDLAKLRSRVTIYGNAGNDYYGLSGGYLDSDAEVVAAGARSRMAISVPQFFENHRGLRTWFPGLDRLGFFEYPSRIIQYMAMGLPVINVIPGRPSFATFPEMLVCDDFSEADAQIANLVADDAALRELSEQTARRFDRHYSALSRALLLEDLTRDESWRHADASERAAWFTRYDASDVAPSTPLAPVTPLRESIRVASNAGDTRQLRIGVLGIGWTEPASRLSTTLRALNTLGHQVVPINPAQNERALVPDPSKLSKHAINVSRLSRQLDDVDVLIVCGLDAGLTSSGRALISERAVTTIVLDDTGNANSKRIDQFAGRFDVVAVASPAVVDDAQRRGHENVVHLPPFVDEAFLRASRAVASENASTTRWIASTAAEEAMAPGYAIDVSTPAQSWDTLSRRGLDDLARTLTSTLSFASHGGSRANPRVSHFLPYLVAASEWLVLPRLVGTNEAEVFSEIAVLAREPGEVAVKLRQLDSSSSLQRHLAEARRSALETTLNAEHQLNRLLEEARRPKQDAAPRDGLCVDHERPTATVALSEMVTGGSAAVLQLDRLGRVTAACGQVTLAVASKGNVVWRRSLAKLGSRIVVGWRSQAQLAGITLTLEVPKHVSLARSEWCGIDITSKPSTYATVAASEPVFVAE